MSVTSDPFVETALKIGVELCRDAIWSGRKCNWVGPSMEHVDGAWKVVHRAYGTDLYSGTVGIGHFLSHLYYHTNDGLIRKAALGCFEHAVANRHQTPTDTRIGFYTGWAGVAYALGCCAPLLGTEAFEYARLEILNELVHCDLTKCGTDVLSGCAGAVTLMLSQRGANASVARDAAIRIGDRLIDNAHKSANGWSWNTLDPQSIDHSRDLTGFSHGAAGIGWSFMELFAATKDDRYRIAGNNAFAYERGLYNAAYGNWPDLRNFDNTAKTEAALYGSVVWCHGAPGIGLSRLRSYALTQDDELKQEAEVAVRTTEKIIEMSLQTGSMNYSMCHGLAGNADTLIVASDTLKTSQTGVLARQAGLVGIDRYPNADIPWACGVTGAGEVPGLMLGKAGIGYFYLRLQDSKKTPSLLLPIPH